MTKPSDPRQLAVDLLARSTCAVQVAAVLVDKWGIFGWGWNNVGDGFGEHAECAAIRRCNRDRLFGSTIYVASQRKRTNRDKPITSKPCSDCQELLNKWGLKVVWRDAEGEWNDT